MKNKILFLIGTLNLDGASTWMHALIKNIDRSKFEPIVCLFIHAVKNKRVEKMMEEMNCKIVELHAPRHKISPLHFFKFFLLLKEIKPALLVLSNIQLAFLGRFFSQLLKIPNISIYHSVYDRHNNIVKFLEKNTINLSNKVVCVSQGVASSYQEIVNINSIETVNNAVDIDENFVKITAEEKKAIYEELNLSSSDLIYLCVARLHPAKNHKELIYAFHQFINNCGSHYKLILAGGGGLYKELLHLIKSLKIENNILLIGPRDDVFKLYQVADFFILPSLYEGFGITIIEAMKFGLPVLLTNLPAFKDIVDNNNAIIVDGFNRKCLFSLLLKSQNIGLKKYQYMSSYSQHHSLKFSASSMAQKYENIITQVISNYS